MPMPTVRVQRRALAVPGVGELPVLSVLSDVPGPLAVLTANMHGDECTGIGVVHRLRQELPGLLRKGGVLLFPSLNPEGLAQGTRGLPGDEKDPNRAFPGDPNGSPVERLAHAVWSEIAAAKASLLVDLHTDAAVALPYAILDRVVRGEGRAALDARCQALAQATGLTVLHEYPRPRYLRYGLDRSLPGALVNGPAIPAVTLEVGPRRALDPQAVELALVATLGVLTAAGLVQAPAPVHSSRVAGGPWRRESGPRTSQAGVLEVLPAPGQPYVRGALLARVRALDGRVLQELHATADGFVVAVPDRCWVPATTACATLAVPDV